MNDGIFFNFSTKLQGESLAIFNQAVERELLSYLASEEGKSDLHRAVKKEVQDAVSSEFSFARRTDPNYAKFRDIVTRRVMEVPVHAVGAEMEP